MPGEEEITSQELDALLDEAETLEAPGPHGPAEMRLFVSVDEETLDALQRRADASGTELSDAAARALRAGSRAA